MLDHRIVKVPVQVEEKIDDLVDPLHKGSLRLAQQVPLVMQELTAKPFPNVPGPLFDRSGTLQYIASGYADEKGSLKPFGNAGSSADIFGRSLCNCCASRAVYANC